MAIQYTEFEALDALRASTLALSADILKERVRQNSKFTGSVVGVQRHNMLTWATVLSEECGEVSKAALDYSFPGTDPFEVPTIAHLRQELVQVAAVAAAFIERIDADDAALFSPEGTFRG